MANPLAKHWIRLLIIAFVVAACDNPIEKNAREQLSGPIAQNTQYAIDDVVKVLKPGIECSWAARDAEGLRTNPDNVFVRAELKNILARAKHAGCTQN
jgi:hypothetical protein